MAKRASTTKTKKTVKVAKKATAKPAAKKRAPKKKTAKSAKKPKVEKTVVAEDEVSIDRRRDARCGNKDGGDAKTPVEPNNLKRRKKVSRRRQIDPTTCERDYSDEEIEFMGALDAYKRANGRMFPTCSEVLEVIRDLGYVKLSASELTEFKANEQPATVVARPYDDEDTDHDESELFAMSSAAF